MRLPARLEEQGDVEDDSGLPCRLGALELLLYGSADHGMRRLVEPALLGRVGKGNLTDAAPIEMPVRQDDALAEMRAVGFVERCLRLHKPMRDSVGIDDAGPPAAQDARGRALAARDAARQANALHSSIPFSKINSYFMMIVPSHSKKRMKVTSAKSDAQSYSPYGEEFLSADNADNNACRGRRW